MVKSQAQLTKQWCRTNINRNAVCLSPLAPFFNPLGPFPPPRFPLEPFSPFPLGRFPPAPFPCDHNPCSPWDRSPIPHGTVAPDSSALDRSARSPLGPFHMFPPETLSPILHGTIPPVPLVAIPPFASRAFLHIPTWVCPNLVPSGIVPPVTPGTVPPSCPWGRFTCTPWDRSACSLWDC
jgi:hypothetical protein